MKWSRPRRAGQASRKTVEPGCGRQETTGTHLAGSEEFARPVAPVDTGVLLFAVDNEGGPPEAGVYPE